jgi:hypothetical protein
VAGEGWVSARLVVVGLIVVGVALAGGGATYYLTSKTPPAEAPLPTLANAAPAPTAAQLDRLAATVAAMPRPAEPELAFADALNSFDYRTQHFIWVLPPGIHAKGPFVADAHIAHAGEPTFDASIPLTAEFPTPGSRPEYPRSAEIVRLSADATWPKHLADIKAAADALVAKYGPGDNELTVSTDLKTEIGAEVRQGYCVDGAMPDVRVFIEQDGGEPSTLKRVDIAAAAPILKAAVLAGCKTP